MAKYKDVQVKHKRTGAVVTISEGSLRAKHIIAKYNLVKNNLKSIPDKTWTKAKIMEYLDTKDIEYAKTDTKAVLLSKVD